MSSEVSPSDPGVSDSVDKRLALMALVVETARRFSDSLDLSKVLSEVLSLTVDTLEADRGSIFLFDHEQRVSRHILARRNLPAEASEQAVSAVLDKGLAGWAVRRRQVALVEDTRSDPRWYDLPDDEVTTRSAVAVPLLHQGRLNGLLTLTKGQPYGFNQEHVDLALVIGRQAAVAVENARLFTRVRDERAVLQALINGVQEPIIVTDTQNRIRLTNPAGRALDERLGEAVGQSVESVVPSEKLTALFRELLDTGQPQADEVPWADGRTFEASLAPVPGVGSVAVLHDVTYFKELDRMKSEFVATVSHDLKSPLTVIYGYVDLLKETLPELTEAAAESLEEIASSAQRMRNLITTLLDLAQIESGLDRAGQPCQMSLIIKDVLRSHRLQAQEKGVELELNADADLPIVKGHPVRLGQAVANLAGNALKYTPAGGRVTVSALVHDGGLLVQVSDTGPGIPLSKQAGLFGKFYKVGARETAAQEGHGLGLAIVKSVVEAHGGRVWVESSIGHGSTFSFSLPISTEEE